MARLLALSARRKTAVLALVGVVIFLLALTASLHAQTRERIKIFAEKFTDQAGKIVEDSGGGNTKSTDGKLTNEPPTYPNIFAAEKALPQHNLDLPYPEGRHGRYFRVSSQIKALGWNNVLGEALLNAHLAWRTGRAYVFQDYYWKVEYYPWKVPDWPWPQTPLSALIGGPVTGGPWAPGDDTPRSIHYDHWNAVCPPEDTDIIDTDIGKDPVKWESGMTVMNHWTRLVKDSPKRCVDVQAGSSGKDNFPQIFDLWLVSTSRVLDFWPEFRDGPISRLLSTSPLVESAIMRNEHLFHSEIDHPPSVYDRMMAVHIRRGDYYDACKGLSDWNSSFYGWNLVDTHPDPFNAKPGGGWGWNTEENHKMYQERCYPTEEQLHNKILTSKQEWEAESARQGEHKKLSMLYVMTNADKDWVHNDFKPKMKTLGWDRIVSSHDLTLDNEQIGVNMAIDMEYGRLAAVFIGNGWSSMTSNINHRRLVDGRQPLDNRFW